MDHNIWIRIMYINYIRTDEICKSLFILSGVPNFHSYLICVPDCMLNKLYHRVWLISNTIHHMFNKMKGFCVFGFSVLYYNFCTPTIHTAWCIGVLNKNHSTESQLYFQFQFSMLFNTLCRTYNFRKEIYIWLYMYVKYIYMCCLMGWFIFSLWQNVKFLRNYGSRNGDTLYVYMGMEHLELIGQLMSW